MTKTTSGLRAFSIFVLAAGFAGLAAAPAAADAVADFYKGKQITAISGGGAGGGFSFAARLLGNVITKHIPGNPSWVVTAMPGAGGARSMKYIENAAAQDGTVVGVVLPPSILSPLLRPKVGYRSEKLQWIGSITPMPSVLSVWHTTKVQSLDDAKKTKLITGTSSKLSSGYLVAAFINAIAGTKIEVILGYRGGDRQNNAMEKGELEGRTSYYASYKTTKPHWLKSRLIRHIATIGPRDPDLKGVPHVMDLARNEEERQIARFLSVGSEVGHGFYVSSNVHKARVQALRRAFDAALADPAFLAEAKKRNQLVNPIRGEDVQAKIADAMKTPKALVAKFKKMVKLDAPKKKAKK